MSCNYAEGLSDYHDKGVCGLPEQHDSIDDVEEKINILGQWMKKACHVVVHTGAGISTTAGIPDFRGPRGVWTLEQNGERPQINISFDEAVPTVTHMALVALVNAGYVHCVISQNVDGLHLRSGLSAEKLAELHGNMFLDKCDKCKRLFVRNTASKTVGQKNTGEFCPLPKSNNRHCRGTLHDTILDWEDELPERDLDIADEHSRKSDLSICLGSTLQIVPSGNLPLLTKRNGGKLVICNLQPTKHDKYADLIIHAYVDHIMKKLSKMLGVEIPEYSFAIDPTKSINNTPLLYYSPTVKRHRPPSRKPKKLKPEFDSITKKEHDLKDKHSPNKTKESALFIQRSVSEYNPEDGQARKEFHSDQKISENVLEFDDVNKREHSLEYIYSGHETSENTLSYQIATAEHNPRDEYSGKNEGMKELLSYQKINENAFHSGISECSSEGDTSDNLRSVKRKFHSEKDTDVFHTGIIISQSLS